jgi:hypothetical protein
VAELQYSVDALNAKSAFYRAKTLVYVEGDDDVLFWEELFSKVPDFSAAIESVWGSGELEKYIKQIEAGDLHAIAARDSDFLRFQGAVSQAARVIYTFGYSMENSLYTADVIHQLAKTWCKSPSITRAQCSQWLADLGLAFSPLIELDVANAISNCGEVVLTDNCTRFMTGQSSATPCSKKIATHAADVRTRIPSRAVAAAKRARATAPNGSVDHLRGHLLATAVVKFLLQTAKALGKKINVSMDSLYANAISNFARAFGPAHPHYAHYSASISAAAATFR